MINVLQIIDGKSFGGIAKLMYEIEKNISDDIKFDFLTANDIYYKWYNLDVNRETNKGRFLYNYRLYKFLKKNKYDIIHINSGAFFFTFQVLMIAKLAGIKKVVVHSHNTPNIPKFKRLIMTILNPLYRKMIDVKLTCSYEAANSLFTKKEGVKLLKDGIEIEKFKFNEINRNEYRDKLNLNGKRVYGHVGRFEKQKNHDFLLDVFYELQKVQDAVLLLIGDGALKQDMKKKAQELGIEDKVKFLGFREDIEKILNAIDIFLFPSLYEGLAISVIEAQTSGLPVFVSGAIPEEAHISNNFFKINSFDVNIWVNKILNVDLYNREKAYEDTIKNGYDIKVVANELEEIYRSLINTNDKKG